MFAEAKNRSASGALLIGADSFKGPRAVVNDMGEKADLSLFHWDDLAVEPNF